MPRRKRKRLLSSETDHPRSLRADAGELWPAVLHWKTKTEPVNETRSLSWSLDFDRDNDSRQATKMQLLPHENVSI